MWWQRVGDMSPALECIVSELRFQGLRGSQPLNHDLRSSTRHACSKTADPGWEILFDASKIS